MKKIIALALALIMMAGALFMFTGCGDDNLTGFDIELAEAVADKLGLDVEFKLIDWATKEATLNAKTIDCIWNGMSITEERLASMEISIPYLYNKQVAVIRKEDAAKYKTTADMAEALVGAEKGSAGESCIVKADKSLNFGAEYFEQNDQMSVLQKLKTKTIDVGVMDSIMAGYYMSQDSTYADSLMIVENLILATEQYGIGARKGSGLTKKINQALIDLAKDGTIATLAEKYGIKSELCIDTNQTIEPLTESELKDWNYIVDSGKFIVGYTLFAPIAYEEI